MLLNIELSIDEVQELFYKVDEFGKPEDRDDVIKIMETLKIMHHRWKEKAKEN